MSYAIKHILSEIEWDDGKIELPPISRSSNGWVYRPEEAQSKGSGKSFGKGIDGDNHAKKWLSYEIQRNFEKRDWKLPTNIPKVDHYPGLGDDTVQVGWMHPVFGATHIDLRYNRKSYYAGAHLSLTFTFNVLAEDIVNRTIKFRTDLTESRHVKVEVEDKQYLAEYEKFRKDPWGYTIKKLGLSTELTDLVGPHVPLPEVDYSGREVGDEATSWYRMRGNVDLMFEENAERYIVKNIGQVQRLMAAFEHLGFDLAVGWDRSMWGDVKEAVPKSISFVVPQEEGVKGKEEFHRVTIEGTGITVECGYARDEEKYLDYKQRHALSFFEEVFEEEWTSIDKQF